MSAQRRARLVAEGRAGMHQRRARIGLAQRGVAENKIGGAGRDGRGYSHHHPVLRIGRRGAVQVTEAPAQDGHGRIGDAGFASVSTMASNRKPPA